MSREEALDWARRAREVRQSVRAELGAGRQTLHEVLERASLDDLVGAVRLGWALESLPGARKVDTRRRLAALGLEPAAPLGSLDEPTRRLLLEQFAATTSPATVQEPATVRESATQEPAAVPAEGIADRVPPLPEGTSVVVISGPGGVGKGTLVEQLLRRDDRLWLSRSWTTRDRRPGEAADAYHFATLEEFRRRAAAGGFLEWTTFLDYMQGSPVPEPPAGNDVLFEIDVRGAANVKRLYPDALLIFVDAPDRATQEARLRGRGDGEDRVRQRLEKAVEEVELASRMDFVHVVNADLGDAVEELTRLIDRHRSRSVSQRC